MLFWNREKVLSKRKALHSIAVELNRLNQIATAQLQLDLRQANAAKEARDKAAEARDRGEDVLAKYVQPLLDLIGQSGAKPPIVEASTGSGTPIAQVERGGTRVTQIPEAAE